MWTAVFVGVIGTASVVSAHDTGHHADLTRDVLMEAGFGSDAVRSAQVLNFLTDYFSNDVFAPVNPALGAIKAEVAKLHFDNLDSKLGDTAGIARYWSHLAENTRVAARQAASDGDPVRTLAILSISLHAVQDFYSHSNWVESYPRSVSAPYRSETWFSELRGGAKTGLRTGIYPNDPNDIPNSHGGYDDAGMNHDSYVRPRWDEGYVFAFAASVEWVQAFRGWVAEVDPSIWTKVSQLAAPAGLDRDFEAMRRLSEWARDSEANGHWKGSGSGDRAELLAIGASFTAAADSPLVHLFKVDHIHDQLTKDLYATTAAASPPTVLRAATHREVVLVQTEEAHAKNDLGTLEPAIDPAGTPDFYALITIADRDFIEATQIDQDPIKPSWTSIRFLAPGTTNAAIVYRLFDEDGGARGGDDHCDINPMASEADLSLAFTLANGSQQVQSAGEKPDADRAGVSFQVKANSVAPQPPLGIAKAVGEGAPNQSADVLSIQELLNACPPDAGGPDVPLTVDGLIGPKTVKAIRRFQQTQLNFQDGRVDPNGKTHRRLNEF